MGEIYERHASRYRDGLNDMLPETAVILRQRDRTRPHTIAFVVDSQRSSLDETWPWLDLHTETA